MCRVSATTYVLQIHVRKPCRRPAGRAYREWRHEPRIRQLALQRLSLFALNLLNTASSGLRLSIASPLHSHWCRGRIVSFVRGHDSRPSSPAEEKRRLGSIWRHHAPPVKFLCSQRMSQWWTLSRVRAGTCKDHAMHVCIRCLADVSALPPLPSNALRQAFSS